MTLEERLAKLETRLAALESENARLRARVAELEGRASQNSSNSNKPPSSDPPGSRPSKPSTGRGPGGQPGHKPHKRTMLRPTRVTDTRPTACACCGGRRLAPLDAPPRVHQVLDVPVPAPDVHEIRMHGAVCRRCGETSWGALPEGTPAHMFGPRLLGLIAYLLAARMSRRQLRELLVEVFGIPVSLGALSEAEERASNAIAVPVDAAVAHVRGRRVKHLDGSTWRVRGVLAPVWTIATKLVTVFFITSDGTAKTVRALLDSLNGFLVTDRGSQFGFWAMERRQVCWAHLVRKFVAFSERNDEGRELGTHLAIAVVPGGATACARRRQACSATASHPATGRTASGYADEMAAQSCGGVASLKQGGRHSSKTAPGCPSQTSPNEQEKPSVRQKQNAPEPDPHESPMPHPDAPQAERAMPDSISGWYASLQISSLQDPVLPTGRNGTRP